MNVVNQINTENMDQFDAVEIHGLDGEGDIYRGTDAPAAFGVFAHQVEGGVERIAECSTHQEAHDYATELGHECDWPVTDHTGL